MTNGSVKEDITEKIKNAGKIYQLVRGILWKWELSERKIGLFKSYTSILTYGAETWAWTKAEISRLKAVQMGFLRSREGKTRDQK